MQLTDAEKAQLMMKLLPALSHAFAGVEKRAGVCGGDACVDAHVDEIEATIRENDEA